jgi:putative FmdB family regulatory protein
MPIYEYRCGDCKKKVSVFFRSFSVVNHADARCPICQGQHLTRLVSKVRVIRGSAASTGDGGEGGAFDESMFDDVNENDPRSLGRMMRRMADETGEDLGPEFGEVVGRLEKGEDPEAIEKSMPELGEMPGGDPGGGMSDGL